MLGKESVQHSSIAGSGLQGSRLYLYTEFMSLYDSTHNSSRQTNERRKKNRPDSLRVNIRCGFGCGSVGPRDRPLLGWWALTAAFDGPSHTRAMSTVSLPPALSLLSIPIALESPYCARFYGGGVLE
jgi:hypothetical protein